MRKFWMSLTVALVACGGGDDGGDGEMPGDLTVSFPQARGGVFAASPDVYERIPVRVDVAGEAESVAVVFRDVEFAATRQGNDWAATVNIFAVPDGEYPLVARVIDPSGVSTATATLVIANQGRQLTSIAADGNAGTPRLHVAGAKWYLTWTDSRGGDRAARIAELDGAGRFSGEVRTLVDAGEDIVTARTALAGQRMGVLYQHPGGGPYKTFFTIVDVDGTSVVAPIDLVAAGSFGSYGGDVVWDGSGFVVIYRLNDGAGTSHIRWLRVTPAGQVTGPVTVATGGFDPITHIDVEVAGNAVVVAYKQVVVDPIAGDIPKCHTATIDAAGTVGTASFAATDGLDWHHECRLLRDSRGTMLIWGAQDLEDPSDNPPTALRAAAFTGSAGALDPARGRGAVVVTAPLHRSEPALVDGVLAWLDQRSYEDVVNGRIELYAAPIAPATSGFAAGEPTVVSHARFIEGTGELGGAASGTNRVLVWIDERNGGSVVDPRPELFVETLWY